MFHINDIYNFSLCKHLFIKNQTRNITPMHHFVNMDETLSIVVARKLNVNEAFFGQRNDLCIKALEAMNDYQWMIKPRFEYDGLRVKIPFMHQVNDKWDIYFIRNELYPKEDNLQYMADNIWVLEKLDIKINEIYVVHFNPDYVRGDTIDYQEMMIVSEHVYNQKNHPTTNISEGVKAKIRDLSPILASMRSFDPSKLKEPKREKKCTRRVKCRYYDGCFAYEKDIADNSILTLVGSEYKYKMFEAGITNLADADLENIEGTRQQFAQIMADKNEGLFVDRQNLHLWLKDYIKKPIAFLDFEWDRYAIPPYVGMKPFDVLLFQYSLHVYDEKLIHKEYIGVEDCRREFIESLLNDLPKNGSIAVFNASGGEELRLKELQIIYPEYSIKIQDIIDRLVDFSVPFNLGMVYHLKMHGYYSLKRIVEAIDEKFSYHNLDISQALTAVDSWRKLGDDKTEGQRKKLIDDLLAYCAMDTYSLYLIYQWFLKILKTED